MAHLADSIRMGQREMAQMIVDGLRPQFGRSVGLGPQDPGNDSDAEEDYQSPRTRRRGGAPKRRNHWENALSVSFSSLLFRPGLHQIRRRSARICASSLSQKIGCGIKSPNEKQTRSTQTLVRAVISQPSGCTLKGRLAMRGTHPRSVFL
jgi:hypothetical protein